MDRTQHTDNKFHILWKHMELYYSMGISMIWSRLEREIVAGREREPKTPIGTWKEAQSKRYTLEYLSKQMHKANVDIAPTMICGEISGNIEVIDVDTKHWPGIDAMYMSEINKLFPVLYDRLRIHKTMSGGYHIIYRCEHPIGQGNLKLAVKAGYKKAGLETRGEGGYVLLPPFGGYSVHQDRPIPVITIAERDALITVAKLYDSRAATVKTPKKREYTDIYDDNPFEHYNKSSEAEYLLEDYGWKQESESNQFKHYTRPGKNGGISASFIKDSRVYHFFTTSTDFEGDKTYSPSSVLCTKKFNGDWKQTFRYLVDKGYGKLKPEYEKKIMYKHLATPGAKVPANFSEESKRELLDLQAKQETIFKYGIFWEIDEDTYRISRTSIKETLHAMGYARYRGYTVLIKRPYFERIEDETTIIHVIEDYINKMESEEEAKQIKDTFHSFWQNAESYTLKTLRVIDDSEVLKSGYGVQYKAFNNGIVTITSRGVKFEDIDSKLQGRLLRMSDKIDMDYVKEEHYMKGKYYDFLENAIGFGSTVDLKKIIGYLCHDYNHESSPYIICLIEEHDTADGGGSGKGLFCSLLSKWQSLYTTSGSMIKKLDLILQGWNGERILHINDLPDRVSLDALKPFSTEGMEQKKLYKDIKKISAEDMPKLITSTQHGINATTDGGVKRRCRFIPFTSHYNENNSPDLEWGGLFPSVFTKEDWISYYNFIISCVQEYLSDTKIRNTGNSEKTALKNFDYTYSSGDSSLREWMDEILPELAEQEYVLNTTLQSMYNAYCEENNIRYPMRMQKLNPAIKYYAELIGYRYDFGVVKRVAGYTHRVIEVRLKSEAKQDNVPDFDLF